MRRAIGPGIVFALLGVTLTFGLDAHLWHEFLRHGWDRFRENAEPWVAIGTILLALATTLLAWHTRSEVRIVADQAKASLEEVEVSRKALQTSTRPLLVDAPLGVYLQEADPALAPLLASAPQKVDRATIDVAGATHSYANQPVGYFRCSIPLQNVGPGLALIERYHLNWPDPGVNWTASVVQTAVRPGELTRFDFVAADIEPGAGEEMALRIESVGELELDVYYTDISGDQLTRSRILAECSRPARSDRPSHWRVTVVFLYHAPNEEPFGRYQREIFVVGS